ncbi:NAD(P)-dependent oxidoreductase [Streptomyces sp. SL13]|uniref:NAD(P)-dependent oxidoreductase n=1 Tax=Streptantibioticus silvisoli TaxID=2705255 RepID=A0AA90H0W7_9ACTN|nr:NAD(P)-dependent oxidoreductase [Streptantibioticus silvisoli]MDI5961501.1 NAD(P)-dependent oxidoreductase [Streptantibioticus silvisoli]MDI5968087.1 NAD(P)-dependent oxidoreductase [Streptantibioticus silvisoli]
MTQKITVAVLGTGVMGAAMARNLLKAGHHVTVWNRTRARAEPLVADGARIAEDPADAVRDADAVLTMMLDGPAVLEAVRSAAPQLRPGAVWVQSSTVGPEGLAPLAALATEAGVHLVDAPVLGTRAPAEQGQLQVLAAGPREARPVAELVFDAIGQRTVWLGDDPAEAAASRLKLVVNSWVLSIINGTAEALALARGLGVDPGEFLGLLEGGSLDSPYLRMKAKAVLAEDWTASFPLSGAAKDARLIAGAAERCGVRLDVAEASARRFARAVEQGHGDKDAVATYLASFDD